MLRSLSVNVLALALFAVGCAHKRPRLESPTPAPATAAQKNSSREQNKPAKNTELTLEPIYFATDSAALNSQAKDSLTKMSQQLKKSPGTKLRIEGFADERGSDAHNQYLAEMRARAVMNYLVEEGVDKTSLRIVSRGEDSTEGADRRTLSKKRRVVFVIDSQKGR